MACHPTPWMLHFLVLFLVLTFTPTHVQCIQDFIGACGTNIDLVQQQNVYSGRLSMTLPDNMDEYQNPAMPKFCDIIINFLSGSNLLVELYYLDIMPKTGDIKVCSSGLELFDPEKRYFYGGRICMEGWQWEERHREKQQEKVVVLSSPLTIRFASSAPYRGQGFRLHFNLFRPVWPCVLREFKCRQIERCVNDDLTCDGWDDCGDYSDERIDAGCSLLTASEICALIIGVLLVLGSIVMPCMFCITYRRLSASHGIRSDIKYPIIYQKGSVDPVFAVGKMYNSQESLPSKYSRSTVAETFDNKINLEKADRISNRTGDNMSERSYRSNPRRTVAQNLGNETSTEPVKKIGRYTYGERSSSKSSLNRDKADLANEEGNNSDPGSMHKERLGSREKLSDRDRRGRDRYSDSDGSYDRYDDGRRRRSRERDRRRSGRYSDDDSDYDRDRDYRRRRRRSYDRYSDDSDYEYEKERRRKRHSRERYDDDSDYERDGKDRDRLPSKRDSWEKDRDRERYRDKRDDEDDSDRGRGMDKERSFSRRDSRERDRDRERYRDRRDDEDDSDRGRGMDRERSFSRREGSRDRDRYRDKRDRSKSRDRDDDYDDERSFRKRRSEEKRRGTSAEQDRLSGDLTKHDSRSRSRENILSQNRGRKSPPLPMPPPYSEIDAQVSLYKKSTSEEDKYSLPQNLPPPPADLLQPTEKLNTSSGDVKRSDQRTQKQHSSEFNRSREFQNQKQSLDSHKGVELQNLSTAEVRYRESQKSSFNDAMKEPQIKNVPAVEVKYREPNKPSSIDVIKEPQIKNIPPVEVKYREPNKSSSIDVIKEPQFKNVPSAEVQYREPNKSSSSYVIKEPQIKSVPPAEVKYREPRKLLSSVVDIKHSDQEIQNQQKKEVSDVDRRRHTDDRRERYSRSRWTPKGKKSDSPPPEYEDVAPKSVHVSANYREESV